MKPDIILLVSVFVTSCSCNGQPKANNVRMPGGDTVSGLSKSIYYIYQDSKNNYWFGSDGDGVYRYDGKRIIHYIQKHGLCNDRIRGIQEDNNGNILLNTVNGISKFDGNKLATMKAETSAQPGSGWRLQDRDLWFAGAQDSGVLYRYDGTTLFRLRFPKTKTGEDFIAQHSRDKFPHMTFSPYDVYGIYRDRKGNMWFGTNIGLCRYDGKHFAWITEKELGIDAIAFHVRSIIEDSNGAYWFTNTMHRFIIDQQDTGAMIRYRNEAGLTDMNGYSASDYAYFLSGLEDTNGDLWLVTYERGIWRYDGKTMKQYLIKNDKGEIATTFSIYRNRKGTLWVGTHTAGAYRFNGKEFVRFSL